MEQLHTPSQVAAALTAKAALIFKFSPRCGVSAGVYHDVERFEEKHPDVTVYLLNVMENREFAREVELETRIEHASPQAILIKDGKPVWHATHYNITFEDLDRALSRKKPTRRSSSRRT